MKWHMRSVFLAGLLVGFGSILLAGEGGNSTVNAAVQDKGAGPIRPIDEKKGGTFLFLGHSFVMPIANEFKQHPARCGFPNYRQFTKGGAAAEGAPGNLWNKILPDDPVRKLIEAGQVDVIVMTYHPDSGSDLSDYERWIEYALKHNTKTEFFVVAPWPPYQHSSLAEFEREWKRFHGLIVAVVEQLQQNHPGVPFTCIPQGKGVVELRQRLEKGQLPELAGLCKAEPNGKTGEFLFVDTFGHGGRMIHTLSQLVWLAVIYRVDVRTYDWDTGYTKIDLKKLAWEVSQEATGPTMGKK
jgi:hypothetical protein